MRLKAKNAAHVGWWSSRCLPYFCVLGAPKARAALPSYHPSPFCCMLGAPKAGTSTSLTTTLTRTLALILTLTLTLAPILTPS